MKALKHKGLQRGEHMLICAINIFNKNGKGLLDEILLEKDFNWREMVILMVLENVPGATAIFLKKFLQTDKANVTKLIQGLEEKNYLLKKENEKDKRSKRIFLTPAGKEILPWLHESMNRWESLVYLGLSKEELSLYQSLNERILSNLIGGEVK